MKFIRQIMRQPRRLRDLFRENGGAAAVELGFVLPVMVLMLFTGMEIAQAFVADRRANLVSRVVSDLTSQGTTITNAEMALIFSAGTEIVKPFDTSKLEMIITTIYIESATKAKVVWSDGFRNNHADPGHNPGDVLAIPPGLMIAGTYVVLAEIKFKYVPVIGTYFTPTGINLTSNTYTRPRRADTVGRSAT